MTHPAAGGRRGQGRVGFLAHRAEIRAALVEGWSCAAVHERVRDRVGVGYHQFRRYVERYLGDLRPADPPGQPPSLVSPHTDPPAPAVRTRAADAPPTPAPRFTYDPRPISKDQLV